MNDIYLIGLQYVYDTEITTRPAALELLGTLLVHNISVFCFNSFLRELFISLIRLCVTLAKG